MPEVIQCRTCAAPAPPKTGRRGPPPETHDPCSRFGRFWTAAQAALEQVVFADTPDGDEARARIAAELRAEANRLMSGQWERDEAGRFAGRR